MKFTKQTKYCGIICFMIFASIGFSATKIALVSDSPKLQHLTELVLAAMSDHNGIEFLERTQIENVLKERKLAAGGITGTDVPALGNIMHTDLFAVINARSSAKGKDISASGLIIYDAKSGFRLTNVNLSEKDTVTEIVERLSLAVDLHLNPDKQIWLSVAAVRDAGVPARLKYKMAHIAAEIERRLGGIPGVIMLERDYLESVNTERKLTGKIFKLAPSARLVRLEFTPGSSADIVNLQLRITNAAGNELFSLSQPDCLKNVKNNMMRIMREISHYLNVSERELYSSEQEAKRFFAEYEFLRRQGNYNAARRRLNSAIALDPDNYKYRIKELMLNAIIPGIIDQKIKYMNKNLELCLKINNDFPEHGNCLDWAVLRNFFKWPHASGISRQDMAKLAKFADRLRKQSKKEFCRFNNFNPDDLVKNHDDIKKVNMYFQAMVPFELYWNFEKWLDSLSKLSLQLLKKSIDFYCHHPQAVELIQGKRQTQPTDIVLIDCFVNTGNIKPEMRKVMLKRIASSGKTLSNTVKTHYKNNMSRVFCLNEWMYGLRNIDNKFSGNRNISSEQAVHKFLKNSGEYIKLAQNHPVPDIRKQAYQLELWKKTIESNFDETEFEKNMRRYCDQVNREFPNVLKNGRGMSEALAIWDGPLQIREKRSPLFWIARKVATEYYKRQNVPSGEMALKQIFRCKNVKKRLDMAINSASEILQYYSRNPINRKALMEFKTAYNYLDRDVDETYKNWLLKKAIAALSPTLQVSTLYKLNSNDMTIISKKQTRYIIEDGKFHDGRIYLLLKTWRKNAAVAKFDLASGKLNILSSWTSKPEGRRNDIQTWTTNGKYAAVCDRTSIRILRLDRSEERIIRDLPAENVMSVTIMNNRIYAFLGRNYNSPRRDRPAETILFSCGLDGSSRKILISTLSEQKRYKIENKPFTVNALIVDSSRRRLVFIAKPGFSGPWSWVESYHGLFEYYIDSGKLNKLLTCKIRGFCLTGNQIFMKCYFERNKEKFLLYDLRSNKICSVFELAGSFRFSLVNIYGYFYARKGQLWFYNGSFIDYVSAPDSKRYPVLLPENSSFINTFPHTDDRSVVIIMRNGIYKATPKQ